MISLIKFKNYLTGGGSGGGKSAPPVSIKASDLDDNFAAVTPQEGKQGLYKIIANKLGFSLDFQANNKPATWVEITICVDGTEKKMMVLGTQPY